MKSKRLRASVGSETARMLKLGHPWVIADRFTAQWPKGECGALLELVDDKGDALGTALYDPGARVVARRLSDQRIEPNREWFAEKFRSAEQSRNWLDLGDTTVSRLVNAEGDQLPGLTVDRYGDYLMLQYFSASWKPWLDDIVAALEDVYRPKGIYGKFRPQQTRKLAAGKKRVPPQGQLLAGKAAPQDLTVRENGLLYRIDLVDDLNTGLFHDQRCNRLDLRKLSAGAKVLNLFAYTGAFSVAAAAAGAECVTSVDNSGRYLDWAKENFRLNDIDPKAHQFITGDCFDELSRMVKQGRSFDIVLMDPPSFSTTRKSRFTTTGGTADLIGKALKLLPNGGLLITSSNLQKMSQAEYVKELRKGALAVGRSLQPIKVSGQADDFPFNVGFPEGNYLKYVVSVVKDVV
ncbi:MAG: class I SAM-dependent rRNA methyltransferase [Desulfuromonadales bacterium]|nr:class I SAM-dependent rRNA methyltransferase [Desulfuromonadales bacterium]